MAAYRYHALRFHLFGKQHKQSFFRSACTQGFSEQPDGFGVGNLIASGTAPNLPLLLSFPADRPSRSAAPIGHPRGKSPFVSLPYTSLVLLPLLYHIIGVLGKLRPVVSENNGKKCLKAIRAQQVVQNIESVNDSL